MRCELFLAVSLLPWAVSSQDNNRCDSIASTFSYPGAIITNASFVAANSQFPLPGICGEKSASTGNVAVCRIQLTVETSESSRVKLEAWMPDVWYGRMLGLGNGGLGGCIQYENLAYGTHMHFATIGSDNGHDGMSGLPFLRQPEVTIDFAYRSIHVESQVGKALIEAYYDRPQDKSYYIGCSTGGRQAIKNAEMYPSDFDGLIAGAPAVDFNHLLSWLGFISIWSSLENDESLFGHEGWNLISKHIMDHCDALDGKVDGIITEPDDCIVRPEELLCGEGQESSCLNEAQVEAVRKIYSPFLDQGEILYPRFDPGAEAESFWVWGMSGRVFAFTEDWYRYAVYNDSDWDPRGLTMDDVRFVDGLDPGHISTWSGDLRAFKETGGKIISYHGRRDHLIPSGNSKRLYDRISSVMNLPEGNLDSFFRTFMIPGMEHCIGGQGAHAFGQGGLGSNVVNDTQHNILLALVDWVEKGDDYAPRTITGVKPGPGGFVEEERIHCRYPLERSVWLEGGGWECLPTTKTTEGHTASSSSSKKGGSGTSASSATNGKGSGTNIHVKEEL